MYISKILCSLFEYEMILNEKYLNYKVLYLIKIYNIMFV
jgi:hypothetical protein